MKKCPYCGKEYPDDVAVCIIDQNPLEPFDPVIVTEECQGKTLIALCNAVSRINEQTSKYTFGVDRAMKIAFRGQEVYLVVGDVGSAAATNLRGGWSRWKIVYALAQSRDQITWMARNADVFGSVCNDSTFPVFWTKRPLLRQIPQVG